MKKLQILLAVLLVSLFLCQGAWAMERLKLATTTSTENSGLLAVLIPPFEKAHNCKVDVIAVGTGKAIKIAEQGNVDVILVHARKLEDKFVAEGYGVNRRDVMYNDFVVLGPQSDPAHIAGDADVADAMKKIAEAKVRFVSRGDESGTHQKEKALWQAAGITPKGSWYISAGQGMGAVISMATEMQAYTLSDRGTYIAYEGKSNLKILVQGDKRLFNPYGVIAVNPVRYPQAKYDLAMAFIAYITNPAEGQKVINGYHKHGQQLFFLYGKK
jgi:tungstate transport system substrate-binding protein